jgi:hypothetical protein
MSGAGESGERATLRGYIQFWGVPLLGRSLWDENFGEKLRKKYLLKTKQNKSFSSKTWRKTLTEVFPREGKKNSEKNFDPRQPQPHHFY